LCCNGAKLRQDMRIITHWFNNLPFQKSGYSARAAVLLRAVRLPSGHGGFVGGDDFVGGAVLADAAVIDPKNAVAEAANLVELMGDEDDGAAGAGDVAHFAEALFLEVYIADGEDFVDEEDFQLEMSGDGESQADVHSGRVVLDGRVNEFFEFGEG